VPGSKYSSPYRPGTYTVTVEANVDNVPTISGQTQKSTTYTFTLTDPCDPPNSITIQAPDPDVDYTITQPALTITPSVFVADPSFCLFTVSSSISTLSGGQTPISESADVFTVSYSADNAIVGQTQTITRTATSYSIYEANTSNRISSSPDSFTVTYLNPCLTLSTRR